MKISIIGAGRVGSTLAYTLFIKGLAEELVMVDIDRDKAEGEALDIRHGLAAGEGKVRVVAGDYSDTASSEIVILTAGIPRKPGDSRLDLLKKNVRVMREMTVQVMEYNPGSLLFVVSNPVDVMTYTALKESNLSPTKVFGLGTSLDTLRFRSLLGEYLGVDPTQVDALIIGEHGDSMVPVWSLVAVDGIPLSHFGHPQKALDEIFEQTRLGGAEVIRRKGGTAWAVAMAAASVVEAVVFDQKKVMPVSSLVTDYYGTGEICLSVPTIMGKSGVGKHLKIPLSDEEKTRFLHSATILKEAIMS
ncbi:MAG: L-lactate dehydrogenase [bacterium]